MKSVLFLRIASVLVFVHAILHTVGGVFGKPAPGVASVVAAHMRTQFQVFGVTRSYADFYLGLGLGITIFLTADALLLWILASMAKTDASRLRPLIAVFALAYLAFAANSYLFFFSAPVIAEVLIVASLVAAFVTAKPLQSAELRSAPLKTVQP